jgi:hypothetical protein
VHEAGPLGGIDHIVVDHPVPVLPGAGEREQRGVTPSGQLAPLQEFDQFGVHDAVTSERRLGDDLLGPPRGTEDDVGEVGAGRDQKVGR